MPELDGLATLTARYDLRLASDVDDLARVASELAALRTALPPLTGRLPAAARAELATRLRSAPPADQAAVRVTDTRIASGIGTVGVRRYLPPDASTTDAIVYLHGGGWVFGSPAAFDRQCVQIAREFGCEVYSADYRLAPEHPFPAAVEDTLAVITDVCDTTGLHCTVAGESAGGGLALTAALLLRDTGNDAVHRMILWYPVVAPPSHPLNTDLDTPLLRAADLDWFWQQYMNGCEHTARYAAPGLAPDLTALPPALIITADRDPSRLETERMVTGLRHGSAVHAVFCAGLPHAFRTLPGATGDTSLRVAAEWWRSRVASG